MFNQLRTLTYMNRYIYVLLLVRCWLVGCLFCGWLGFVVGVRSVSWLLVLWLFVLWLVRFCRREWESGLSDVG